MPTTALRGLVALVLATACLPDDWDPNAVDTDPGTDVDTDRDTTDATAPDPALVGAWVSQGDDIGDLFSSPQVDLVRIDATFFADGSYEVVSEDGSGRVGTFTGTYTVEPSTSPRGIRLEQDEPYVAVSEGIYAVDGDVLTYEVVQTLPDYGNVPPSGGFGTSSGPGMAAGANVQTYRRAD